MRIPPSKITSHGLIGTPPYFRPSNLLQNILFVCIRNPLHPHLQAFEPRNLNNYVIHQLSIGKQMFRIQYFRVCYYHKHTLEYKASFWICSAVETGEYCQEYLSRQLSYPKDDSIIRFNPGWSPNRLRSSWLIIMAKFSFDWFESIARILEVELKSKPIFQGSEVMTRFARQFSDHAARSICKMHLETRALVECTRDLRKRLRVSWFLLVTAAQIRTLYLTLGSETRHSVFRVEDILER